MEPQNQYPANYSPSIVTVKSNRLWLVLLILGTILLISSGVLATVFFFPNLVPSFSSKPAGIPKIELEKRVAYQGDIPAIYDDINQYLLLKNRPIITPHDIPTISNTALLEKLNSQDTNFAVIDIREPRETETLIRLNDYPTLRYIRTADLINNFEPIPKDTEIIIVGFTTNRETIAADYLIGEGYTNVKILKDGLLQWSLDNLPTSINKYSSDLINFDNINSILLFLKNPPPNSQVITFGAFNKADVSLLTMDTPQLNEYIDSLSKDKEYILRCETNKTCYEASHFWYIAKDKIKIIGYTGFENYPAP